MRIIIKFFFKIFAIILYRPKIVGKQNLPKENAAIICPNHVHALDSAVIIAMAKRKINVLAKEELFSSKIGRWFADVFGIYPIKRNFADIQAIKISLKLMKNKELLAIFPEGTRNGMANGEPFKSGAILIAIKAGVPIIPTGVQGNFKPFRKVKINYGKPIDYSEYKNEASNKELINKLTEELQKEVIRLTNERI